MRRGDIRWYVFAAPDKRRPVLLLTRDSVIDVLNEIVVVPATRTVRGIATEVVLTQDASSRSMSCISKSISSIPTTPQRDRLLELEPMAKTDCANTSPNLPSLRIASSSAAMAGSS